MTGANEANRRRRRPREAEWRVPAVITPKRRDKDDKNVSKKQTEKVQQGIIIR